MRSAGMVLVILAAACGDSRHDFIFKATCSCVQPDGGNTGIGTVGFACALTDADAEAYCKQLLGTVEGSAPGTCVGCNCTFAVNHTDSCGSGPP